MSVTPPTQEVGKEGRIDSLEMTGESRKEEGLVTVTDFPSHPPPQRSQICSLVQALLPPSPSFHLLSTITGNSQALLKTPSLFQHRSGHTERVWVLQEAEGNSYKKKKKKKEVAQLLFNRQPIWYCSSKGRNQKAERNQTHSLLGNVFRNCLMRRAVSAPILPRTILQHRHTHTNTGGGWLQPQAGRSTTL